MSRTYRYKIEREATEAGKAWYANKSMKRPRLPKWYVQLTRWNNFYRAYAHKNLQKRYPKIEDYEDADI